MLQSSPAGKRDVQAVLSTPCRGPVCLREQEGPVGPVNEGYGQALINQRKTPQNTEPSGSMELSLSYIVMESSALANCPLRELTLLEGSGLHSILVARCKGWRRY